MNEQKQDGRQAPVNPGAREISSEPNSIGASTPYDLAAKNLTAYVGLLPVASMLEKPGFQQLVEETLIVQRKTKAMTMYRFVLAMVLACYVGFSRLHHVGLLRREPMLTGILQVARLPPQCTFWRFLAALHLGAARRGRATAENLIKEANNDAGLTARPSTRWGMNCNWFQIVSSPTT